MKEVMMFILHCWFYSYFASCSFILAFFIREKNCAFFFRRTSGPHTILMPFISFYINVKLNLSTNLVAWIGVPALVLVAWHLLVVIFAGVLVTVLKKSKHTFYRTKMIYGQFSLFFFISIEELGENCYNSLHIKSV